MTEESSKSSIEREGRIPRSARQKLRLLMDQQGISRRLTSLEEGEAAQHVWRYGVLPDWLTPVETAADLYDLQEPTPREITLAALQEAVNTARGWQGLPAILPAIV